MAKTGNHGQIIPRDKALLHRLYVTERRNLSEMAKMFGCKNHNSVANVLRKMGFKMPGQGFRPLKALCIDCGIVRPKVLKHKLAKNGTGMRCHECLKKYKREWLIKALKRRPEEVRAKRKAQMERWYLVGPINPKGEAAWIRKAKHLLRTNRRLLKASPGVSLSLSAASAPAATSQP